MGYVFEMDNGAVIAAFSEPPIEIPYIPPTTRVGPCSTGSSKRDMKKPKHMYIKSIITASLLALSPLFVDRASAIGITTVTIPGNDGSLRSYVHVTPPGITDTLAIPIGVDRFSPIETLASQPDILASHTWRMTNGGNGATIRGKGDVVHNAVQVGDFSIEAFSELFLNFTLTQPVHFTLSSDFSGTLNPGGVAHEQVIIFIMLGLS